MHLEVECFENALTELLSTLSNTKYTKCPQITLLDFFPIHRNRDPLSFRDLAGTGDCMDRGGS